MQRICRFCLLVLPFILVLSALTGAELRIATYNVNNYLVMDRLVEGNWRPSYPKPENEKSVIREIIKDVAPDILVLQEMGTIDFLEELRADMVREGIDYPYAVHMEGADAVRHLAVLSKRKPKNIVKHTNLDFKYFDGRETVKRGMLEMSFDLADGQSFQLFAVHLKSRYEVRKDDPLSQLRRTREARACRDRLIERTVERDHEHYLVAGDFNDHPASAPLRRFSFRGSLEIGSLVTAVDSRGELWTYFYEKEARYEAVDGFIASAAMMPYIESGRGHIADQLGALLGSDHRMVYLDLDLDLDLNLNLNLNLIEPGPSLGP